MEGTLWERGNVTKKGAKGESVGKTAKVGRGGPSGLAESWALLL